MEPGQNDRPKRNATLSEQIDVLKHLSLIQRSQFEIRQRLEWRIVFIALGFYVVAAVTEIPAGLNLYWVRITYIVFTIVILLYLGIIHKNHSINKKAAHVAEDVLWGIVRKEPRVIFRTSLRWHGWYFLGQIIVLTIFALSSFIILQEKISADTVRESSVKKEPNLQLDKDVSPGGTNGKTR